MKKKWMAVALTAVAALGLTACSSAEDPEPSPSASTPATGAAMSEEEAHQADLATLDQITWNEGEPGPTLEFEAPLTMNLSAAKLIADGDGAEIELGQNITLHYTSYLGTDATAMGSTYDADNPEVVSLAEGSIDQALIDTLVGQHVGATFLYGAPNYQLADGSAIFMAVTVADATTPLDRATGTAVAPAEGLPTVTLADNGEPSIDFSTATEKPEELVVQTLIEGDGPVVEENASITVHYSGWLWDGEQFDSSWTREAGPTPFTTVLTQGALIDGWIQGLQGVTVGSQVMLVIPPELGYGETGSGESIPGDSTLVFVVDVLATS